MMAGDLVHQDTSCLASCGDSLKIVAQMLISSGRTALAVADVADNILGLVTENDILRIYFKGEAPERSVGDWLSCGKARASPRLLKRLIIRPTQSLTEVAHRMVENAIASDCACHHVVVQEDNGTYHGILSSLELANIFSCPDDPEAGARTVREMMKCSDQVYTCTERCTMKQAMKIMIVTRQNCVLVFGEDGLCGMVTPRDALQGFVAGALGSCTVAEWLQRSGVASCEHRLVRCDASVMEAASHMIAHRLHHLAVVKPESTTTIGVMSALDIVMSSRKDMGDVDSVSARLTLSSPVAEFVKGRRAPSCHVQSTFGEAAGELARQSCTSMLVLNDDGAAKGVLTESDFMQAYVDGWSKYDEVGRWLLDSESRLPRHLMVLPEVPLTEVATMMLVNTATEIGCGHFVVMSADGQFHGVLSALDIVRALCELGSEVELSETSADQAGPRVSMVRPSAARGKPTDTIAHAFDSVLRSHGGGVLIEDGAGAHGIITPRVALHAISKGVSSDAGIADLLQAQCSGMELQSVTLETPLVDAARAMIAHSLSHLVVVAVRKPEPVALLSSLDVLRGIASLTCNCRFVSLRWLKSRRWSRSASGMQV